MKNYIKNAINLSIVSSIVLLNTGCSMKEVTPENQKNFDKTKENFLNIKDEKAIEIIEVDKIVYKQDSLNQDLNFKSFVEVSNNKVVTLEELFKKFPLNVYVEDKIKNQLVGNIQASGDIKEVLDKVTSATNTFWTYDQGVIKIINEKTIVYKFPMFSNAKLSAIYNVGMNDAPFDVTKVKEDVFQEISDSLKMILNTEAISGDIGILSTNIKENNNKVEKENATENVKQNLKTEEDKKSNTQNNNKNSSFLFTLGTQKKKADNKNEETGIKTPSQKKKTNDSDIGDQINNDIVKYELENKSIDQNDNSKKKSDNVDVVSAKSSDNTKSNTDNLKNRNNNLNSENISNKVQETTNLHKIITAKTDKVMISKESGMIVVSVTRNEESKVDNVIDNLIKNVFNNMVTIDLYILEVQNSKLKQFSSDISGIIQDGLKTTSLALNTTGITGVIDGLTNKQLLSVGTPAPDVMGSKVSAILGYLTDNQESKILSQPKILTMPNIPSRIKTSTAIPYVQPQSISNSASAQTTYEIKYVNDGIDMAVVSNVIDDDIYLSLGVNMNQYIDDKIINVGTFGTINVPIQAPKILNSTFRMKAGNFAVLGGMNKIQHSGQDKVNTMIPINLKNKFEETSIVVLAMPRLIKFVEKKETNKNNIKTVDISKDNKITTSWNDSKFPVISSLK